MKTNLKIILIILLACSFNSFSFGKDNSRCSASLSGKGNLFLTQFREIDTLFTQQAANLPRLFVDKNVSAYLAAVKTALTFETSKEKAQDLSVLLKSPSLIDTLNTPRYLSITHRLQWQMGEVNIDQLEADGLKLVQMHLEKKPAFELPKIFWKNVIQRSVSSGEKDDRQQLVVTLDIAFEALKEVFSEYVDNEILGANKNRTGIAAADVEKILGVFDAVFFKLFISKFYSDIQSLELQNSKETDPEKLDRAFRSAGYHLSSQHYRIFKNGLKKQVRMDPKMAHRNRSSQNNSKK